MIMQHHPRPDPPIPAQSFPTDPTGLPEAGRPALLELADGDTLDLQVGPVAKRLLDATVRMLGYNATIPGPTLKVQLSNCAPSDLEPRARGASASPLGRT